MINEAELRRGNWIMDDSDELPLQVTWVILKEIHFDTRNYSPIPLDASILEKAGFVIGNNKNYCIHFTRDGDEENQMVLFIGRDDTIGYWFGLQNTLFDTIAVQTIKYLHQLQNLYFALTQTELTINL